MDFGACEEPTRKKLSKQGQSRSCTLTPLSPSECETTTSCAPQLLSRSYSAGSSSVGAACGDVHGVERRRSEGAGARLSRKVKEQRARFYIMRRCIHMLVCWRDDTHH